MDTLSGETAVFLLPSDRDLFEKKRKEFASAQGGRGMITLLRETTVSKLFFAHF